MADKDFRTLTVSRAASLAAVLTLLASPSIADGIPSYFDPVRERWRLLDEPAQHAVIALRDGQERLLLKVHVRQSTTPQEARQLVWITPIPSEASAVTVNILRGFPTFHGQEPGRRLAKSALVSLAMMSLTQIYPVFLAAPFMLRAPQAPVGAPTVTVHETVQRDGVELQLVTADSTPALDLHLRKLGVELPREGLRSLETYVGDSACFVLFRIVDLAAYRKSIRQSLFALGIEVRFPTKNGFFPLTASSAIPTDLLEVSVVVPQFVTSVDPLPNGMSARHRVGRVIIGPEAREALGISNSPINLRYTEFRLLSSPKLLKRDLRFIPGAPRFTRLSASCVLNPMLLWFSGFVLFIGLSVASAQSAYFAWPKRNRPSRLAVSFIGLSNLLTILGVLIATLFIARRLGVSAFRSLLYTALTSFSFCFYLLVLSILLLIPLA